MSSISSSRVPDDYSDMYWYEKELAAAVVATESLQAKEKREQAEKPEQVRALTAPDCIENLPEFPGSKQDALRDLELAAAIALSKPIGMEPQRAECGEETEEDPELAAAIAASKLLEPNDAAKTLAAMRKSAEEVLPELVQQRKEAEEDPDLSIAIALSKLPDLGKQEDPFPVMRDAGQAQSEDPELAAAIAASRLPEYANGLKKVEEKEKTEEELMMEFALQESLETAEQNARASSHRKQLKQEFSTQLRHLLADKTKHMRSAMNAIELPEGIASLIASYSPTPNQAIQYAVNALTATPTTMLENELALSRVISETGQFSLNCYNRLAWKVALSSNEMRTQIANFIDRMPMFTTFALERLETSELFDEIARERFTRLEHLELPWSVCYDANSRRDKESRKTVLESHIFDCAPHLTSLTLHVWDDLALNTGMISHFGQWLEPPEEPLFRIPSTVTRLELRACYGAPATIAAEIKQWVKRALADGHTLVESSLKLAETGRGHDVTITLVPEDKSDKKEI